MVIIELPQDMEKAGFNVVQKSVFSTKKLRALGWTMEETMKNKMLSTIEETKQNRNIYKS